MSEYKLDSGKVSICKVGSQGCGNVWIGDHETCPTCGNDSLRWAPLKAPPGVHLRIFNHPFDDDRDDGDRGSWKDRLGFEEATHYVATHDGLEDEIAEADIDAEELVAELEEGTEE